jgi:Tfp pilus assembly protein PilN
MSTTTTAVQTGTLPRVNLLPQEIAESAKFRTAQMVMGLGVLASIVVVAGLFLLASSDESAAQDQLSSAQSTGTTLQQQVATFASVPVVFAQAETAKAQLDQAMSQEIRYSFVLNDLSLGMPSGVWLTQMSITQVPDAPGTIKGAWGNGTDGTVVLQGESSNLPQVAGWLQALAAQKSYTDPYITNTQGTTGSTGAAATYTFTSQVNLSAKALSNRYAKVDE